jgi:DNA-binding NtrC family response regulator
LHDRIDPALKKPKMADHASLLGTRILVVEDDFLISLEVSAILANAGARIVGPARTVDAALRLIENEIISAAILDVRISEITIEDVVRKLIAKNIPWVFYTAQPRSETFHKEWPNCRFISKPAPAQTIVTAVARLIKRETGQGGRKVPAQRRGDEAA